MREPLDDRDNRLEGLEKPFAERLGRLFESVAEGNGKEFEAGWKQFVDDLGKALLDAMRPEYDLMSERAERFAQLRPVIHERLRRHCAEGRIVRGQLWRCSQHPLTAEALDEEASKQTGFNFKTIDEGIIDPDLKWELLQFHHAVERRVLQYALDYESRPEAERRAIEIDFPYARMDYAVRGAKLPSMSASDLALAMMFPSSYMKLIQKLAEDALERM